MTRSSRLALALLLPVIVLGAAYIAYWFYLARGAGAAIENWASARTAAGTRVAWAGLAVDGFPLRLRVTLERPELAERSPAPGYTLTAPLLVGEARPWAPRRWTYRAPQGLRLAVDATPERPAATVESTAATGSVAPAEMTAANPAGTAVALVAERVTIAAGPPVTIARAAMQAILPGRAATSHLETWLVGDVALDGVTLPAPVAALGDTVRHIDGKIAIKGTIPGGPRPAALDAWRRDGGTAELEAFDLEWGKLAATADGTLSLDEALQPIGAMTARISGQDAIIDALVAGRSIQPGDAQVAKIALGLLAKPGPTGAPEVVAPVTLQNGYLFIGPARLARLPHFTWE